MDVASDTPIPSDADPPSQTEQPSAPHALGWLSAAILATPAVAGFLRRLNAEIPALRLRVEACERALLGGVPGADIQLQAVRQALSIVERSGRSVLAAMDAETPIEVTYAAMRSIAAASDDARARADARAERAVRRARARGRSEAQALKSGLSVAFRRLLGRPSAFRARIGLPPRAARTPRRASSRHRTRRRSGCSPPARAAEPDPPPSEPQAGLAASTGEDFRVGATAAPVWIPLAEAARLLAVKPATLRRSLERHAVHLPDGRIAAALGDVLAEKPKGRWRIALPAGGPK